MIVYFCFTHEIRYFGTNYKLFQFSQSYFQKIEVLSRYYLKTNSPFPNKNDYLLNVYFKKIRKIVNLTLKKARFQKKSLL